MKWQKVRYRAVGTGEAAGMVRQVWTSEWSEAKYTVEHGGRAEVERRFDQWLRQIKTVTGHAPVSARLVVHVEVQVTSTWTRSHYERIAEVLS